MVHNLPENFNISDFDVFHSALTGSALSIFLAGVNVSRLNAKRCIFCNLRDIFLGAFCYSWV